MCPAREVYGAVLRGFKDLPGDRGAEGGMFSFCRGKMEKPGQVERLRQVLDREKPKKL